MSEKPISPLRQRMLEDMSLRGFTPDTQRDYIRAVKKLAAFLGRSIPSRWTPRPAMSVSVASFVRRDRAMTDASRRGGSIRP